MACPVPESVPWIICIFGSTGEASVAFCAFRYAVEPRFTLMTRMKKERTTTRMIRVMKKEKLLQERESDFLIRQMFEKIDHWKEQRYRHYQRRRRSIHKRKKSETKPYTTL